MSGTEAAAQRVEHFIPGGVTPPPEIPAEIFQAAVRTYVEPRRLDMQALALELGIGRTTLYRRAGHRDRLLGEAVWFLTRGLVAQALELPAALRGTERVVTIVRRFMELVQQQPPHHRFLGEEPEAALRILTSKHGPVQTGMVHVVERLLAREEDELGIAFAVPRDVLAYTVVRIGEGFLYADVVADAAQVDLDRAAQILQALLDGLVRDAG